MGLNPAGVNWKSRSYRGVTPFCFSKVKRKWNGFGALEALWSLLKRKVKRFFSILCNKFQDCHFLFSSFIASLPCFLGRILSGWNESETVFSRLCFWSNCQQVAKTIFDNLQDQITNSHNVNLFRITVLQNWTKTNKTKHT